MHLSSRLLSVDIGLEAGRADVEEAKRRIVASMTNRDWGICISISCWVIEETFKVCLC